MSASENRRHESLQTEAVELTIKGDVTRLPLKPGDIVVIHVHSSEVGPDRLFRIAEVMKRVVRRAGHDNEVIAHDDLLQIEVVAP